MEKKYLKKERVLIRFDFTRLPVIELQTVLKVFPFIHTGVLGREAYLAGTLDTRTRSTFWVTMKCKRQVSLTEFIAHIILEQEGK